VNKLENLLALSSVPAVQILIEIAVFLALTLVGMFIVRSVSKSNSKIFNPREFFPEEEVHTLTQLAYLALMSACFINVMYTLIYVNVDSIYFALADITLSLFIAVTMDKSTTARKLFLLLVVPYGALSYLLFNNPLVGFLDLFHVIIFICFIKVYYDRFMEYTQSNALGIAIVLVFSIIFVSFIITSIVEPGSPLDSIVMVSSAFTSNGYVALGDSDVGKLNSLILVWSGFIISAVGTATLTAAILTRHFNKKIKDYDNKFESLNNNLEEFDNRFDELESLIKGNFDD
jgi:hypothetical protein